MFILSLKAINTKEDSFHRDFADEEKLRAFMQSLFELNKNSFFKHFIESSRERDEDNNYVMHNKIGIFKTELQAKSFFDQLTNSEDPVRIESREWNQQHEILSKANIIDVKTNTSIRELLNCLSNTCERFGGKCDETNGCSTVPFAREYTKNKKPFPIKVMVG